MKSARTPSASESDRPDPDRRGGAGSIAWLGLDLIDPHSRLTGAQHGWLRRHLAAAAHTLNCSGEIRVRIADDAEMSRTHEQFSGVTGATDVLTFDLRDDPNPDAPLDTDLVLCIDEARRHAAEHGHTPERELLLYALHGLLHCLGYDDHTPADAEAMHAREDDILRRIGVGATYAPAAEVRP